MRELMPCVPTSRVSVDKPTVTRATVKDESTQEVNEVPEGPEVRKIRDRLHFALVDPQTIYEQHWNGPLDRAGGSFRDPAGRYAKKPPIGFEEISKARGLRVDEVESKGKFLWWRMSGGDGSTWWMHCTLGMTGIWHIGSFSRRFDHQVIRFRYSRNNVDWHTDGGVYFADSRKFGTLKFVKDEKQHEKKLASLGPDMLVDPPEGQEFIDLFRRKNKKTLAEVLMDQSVVSGIGNYLKAETLYTARLSPNRLVKDCADYELENLWVEVLTMIKHAYEHDGATVIINDSGRYRHVYGHRADAKGRVVIKEKTKDGRSTWWCPEVQK